MAKWSVKIDNFLGGLAPNYQNEDYPSYGNTNQAAKMEAMDLTNPGYMQAGPALTVLTNGDEDGAVTKLIRSILEQPVTSDTTYGIGDNLLHQITSTAVTNAGSWPHTIDKAAVTNEDGEDVVEYGGNLYYSYNHSGSAGDIGKYDLSSTFDDDWGSTVPSGAAALQDAPHQMIVGGNDVMYIANGRYVASYDGTTFIPQALDLPAGTEVQSIAWNTDRLWVFANKTNLSGNNRNLSALYIWDGTTNSWESETPIPGRVGGSIVKNGVVFFAYLDSAIAKYFMAYISGSSIFPVAQAGVSNLPQYYQLTDYKDFILFISLDAIYAFGSGHPDLPVRFFDYADCGLNGTVGGMANPFGLPLVATNSGTDYQLAKFNTSGYDTDSRWYSITYDVSGESTLSMIDNVVFTFEKLTSGAVVDWVLRDSKGQALYSDKISFAKLGAANCARYPIKKLTCDFRIEVDYANGSTTVPVRIKSIKVYGDSEH